MRHKKKANNLCDYYYYTFEMARDNCTMEKNKFNESCFQGFVEEIFCKYMIDVDAFFLFVNVNAIYCGNAQILLRTESRVINLFKHN